MSNLVFPTLSPAWGIKRTLITSSLVQRAVSGRRVSTTFQRFPRWRFELQLLALNSDGVVHTGNTADDLRSLMGFFGQMNGKFDSFLFKPRDFNSVTDQALTLLTDDTGHKFSPIRFSIGGLTDLITDLNGNPTVRANAVVKTLGVDYVLQTGASSSTFSEPGLVAAWQTTPTAPITADFNFYYRCAFTRDEQEFENWILNYWKASSLVFESEFDNA